jgi:hypothetical protein
VSLRYRSLRGNAEVRNTMELVFCKQCSWKFSPRCHKNRGSSTNYGGGLQIIYIPKALILIPALKGHSSCPQFFYASLASEIITPLKLVFAIASFIFIIS